MDTIHHANDSRLSDFMPANRHAASAGPGRGIEGGDMLRNDLTYLSLAMGTAGAGDPGEDLAHRGLCRSEEGWQPEDAWM